MRSVQSADISGLDEGACLAVKNIIRPITRTPGEGWDSAFAAMHLNGDDAPLINDVLDLEAWEWK